MDGGGRLDQPLVRRGKSDARQLGALGDEPGSARRHAEPIRRRARHWGERLMEMPLPRGVGIAGSILLLAATLGYGTVAGQHVPDVANWFKDARDIAANSLGFRIAAIALAGEKEVSREEVLTTAGVTGRASLLFLDADAARLRLMANPWIADAAVFKLYPDRLQVTITERLAFALWQKNGLVSVIAADGTVLQPFVDDRYLGLPHVIGGG